MNACCVLMQTGSTTLCFTSGMSSQRCALIIFPVIFPDTFLTIKHNVITVVPVNVTVYVEFAQFCSLVLGHKIQINHAVSIIKFAVGLF